MGKQHTSKSKDKESVKVLLSLFGRKAAVKKALLKRMKKKEEKLYEKLASQTNHFASCFMNTGVERIFLLREDCKAKPVVELPQVRILKRYLKESEIKSLAKKEGLTGTLEENFYKLVQGVDVDPENAVGTQDISDVLEKDAGVARYPLLVVVNEENKTAAYLRSSEVVLSEFLGGRLINVSSKGIRNDLPYKKKKKVMKKLLEEFASLLPQIDDFISASTTTTATSSASEEEEEDEKAPVVEAVAPKKKKKEKKEKKVESPKKKKRDPVEVLDAGEKQGREKKKKSEDPAPVRKEEEEEKVEVMFIDEPVVPVEEEKEKKKKPLDDFTAMGQELSFLEQEYQWFRTICV